ncbi:hypothetical protein KAFR_0D02180 [Kazachstania africana CBS 2517]|uniref:Sugar utilization regulatory protein IMP2 n=1 Tax=Kazachstania africana (strain ATCC 22294 / BCRC 22015 / CBS 2517 / CECT 1963 / NBRC 1671 / NRRL Y-8276) TaxID=1071382 RepID=H2AU15_KAZAF|nr:hypothetical protein KAFR_0D02180 [Kazachstania africana CBS 2517]CCF57865.1 hypothetical protein KAFR_0D02180 [Kazachstania africana CBS 2517]
MVDNPNNKSILLTTPDGTQAPLHAVESRTTKDSSPSPKDESILHKNATEVQFNIDRGRSRLKKQRSNASTSQSFSRSRSRSKSFSRNSSKVREEEFLKWTVLRQDPSMRLFNANEKLKKKEGTYDSDEIYSSESVEDEDKGDDEDEDEDEESEDFEEEESDEEQVSDIDNEVEIDEKLDFDLGMKVLPNFCVSINEVLESRKPWVQQYEKEIESVLPDETTKLDEIEDGYIRAIDLVTKGEGSSKNGDGQSYILFMDLSSESIYALTYVMGCVINNGDTLYIVNWESTLKHIDETIIYNNLKRVKKMTLHLFDCISGVIDNLDVIIVSLTHPYPKHLLSEMIYGLKPMALCCSLSIMLSTLQNFVCSVPTLVVRRKLKRSKRRGLTD